MIEGWLQGLRLTAPASGPDSAAVARVQAALVVQDTAGATRSLELEPLLGAGIRIEWLGPVRCAGCGAQTTRSYAQGYCYRCSVRLARCDLCVMRPERCHYAEGTCREPEWGESFCMRPHSVYLANTSGPKVGITGQGRETARWIEQGARQGLVIVAAATRPIAGQVETLLARHVKDRADWRTLVRAEPPVEDLAALRERLRTLQPELPPGARWLEAGGTARFRYPVTDYADVEVRRLQLRRGTPIVARLLGVKGQYLLFDRGVLNVGRHRSCRIRAEAWAEITQPQQKDQMELFR